MPNSRSRKLIVVLAAGALTMFGASSAFAAQDGPAVPSATPTDHGGDHGGGGGGGGGGGDPLCKGTPLAGTPFCGGSGEQPPGGGDGGGGGGGSPSTQPADEGGGGSKPDQPYCNNTPLQGTPLCTPSPGEGGEDGGQDPKG
jgi:hypothetical protein